MPTSAVGSRHPWQRSWRSRGFTLLELLIVVAIVAVGSGVAALALRPSAERAIDQQALRIVASLEAARAYSRATGIPVFASVAPGSGADDADALRFSPQPPQISELSIQGGVRISIESTSSANRTPVLTLGPEPLIGAQRLMLRAESKQAWISTDGLRAFATQPEPVQ